MEKVLNPANREGFIMWKKPTTVLLGGRSQQQPCHFNAHNIENCQFYKHLRTVNSASIQGEE